MEQNELEVTDEDLAFVCALARAIADVLRERRGIVVRWQSVAVELLAEPGMLA